MWETKFKKKTFSKQRTNKTSKIKTFLCVTYDPSSDENIRVFVWLFDDDLWMCVSFVFHVHLFRRTHFPHTQTTHELKKNEKINQMPKWTWTETKIERIAYNIYDIRKKIHLHKAIKLTASFFYFYPQHTISERVQLS